MIIRSVTINGDRLNREVKAHAGGPTISLLFKNRETGETSKTDIERRVRPSLYDVVDNVATFLNADRDEIEILLRWMIP
jgi:hypothetical protein